LDRAVVFGYDPAKPEVVVATDGRTDLFYVPGRVAHTEMYGTPVRSMAAT
jgi:hypothetical protein